MKPFLCSVLLTDILRIVFKPYSSIYFYIHEIISLWFKSKPHDSEFHILTIKLKITVYNDIELKGMSMH